jgi:hypothetical protein
MFCGESFVRAITVPSRSRDQAHQHLRSFGSHQVLHSLMERTTEYIWIFRSPMKLCFQRVKNQVNQRFLEADMAESPMVARPDLDSKQSWSETAIDPSCGLRLKWMSTRWKGNFINFSIELYFVVYSVMYEGGNPTQHDENKSGDEDDNNEERFGQCFH